MQIGEEATTIGPERGIEPEKKVIWLPLLALWRTLLLRHRITAAPYTQEGTYPEVVDMSEVLYSFSNGMMCRVVSGKFFRGKDMNIMFRELIEENQRILGEIHIEDFFPKLGWLDMFFGLTVRAEKHSRVWDEVLEKIIRDHDQRSKEIGFRREDFVDALLALQKNGDTGFAFTRTTSKH